jgi:hypothetical protein
MSTSENTVWDGVERRESNNFRRTTKRRTYRERRHDRRDGGQRQSRGFYNWLRSHTKIRLGVDRRKNGDRRITLNRRSLTPRLMLTKDELADLLK